MAESRLPHVRSIATEIQDGVAVIAINNPPVNALSQEVVDALASAISDAQQNSEVRAVVVAGAGRTFVAGADINGLDALAWGTGPGAPEMHDVLAHEDILYTACMFRNFVPS